MRRVPLLICLLGLYAATAAAETLEKNFHESFPVTERTVLTVEHGDGRVQVSPWEEARVDIEVVYWAEYRGEVLGPDLDFTLFTEAEDDRVLVRGVEKGRKDTFMGAHVRYLEYVYRIRAPRTLSLDLHGEDGNVIVKGWSGLIQIDLQDGSIFLTDVEAPRIAVSTEDGDVDLDRVRGSVEIDGEDGSVWIEDSDLSRSLVSLEDGHLRVVRSTGDVTATTIDGSVGFVDVAMGPLSVRTEGGDVDLMLRKGPAVDFDVETDDGDVDVTLEPGTSLTYSLESPDIRLEVPGVVPGALDAKTRGTLHGGNGKLRVRSISGRIALRERH